MIISIPVLSVRSGYAQIQTSSNPELDSIINQKQQDEQTKREALNPNQTVVDGSQEVSIPDPTLEAILKQNEIDNRLKDAQSSEKLEIISDPKGNVTDLGEQADYTFLIYMIGSDLELKQYSATKDIREMLNVGSNRDVNIIIETGGSKSSVTDGERFIDFTTVQRHKILKHHHQTLEDLGRKNMATSNTLSDFLTWGVSEFPAKKYVAILWDHGSGINGFGADNNFNGDILTPVELAKAFEDTKDSTRTNFEIIGFDACLMASIEVANNVKSFGNYMVASQELIPPAGWDYSTFLTSLVKNPSQDGLALGKNIADSFQEYYRINAQELGYDAYLVTTISIIDLHQISDLVNSMNNLARYLNHSISDANSSKSFVRLIDSTDSYGKSSAGQSNLVDIYDLSFNVMRKYPDSFDITDRIHKLLRNVIVYKANGESKPNANGLSIYLPNTYGQHLSQSVANSLETWQQIVNKQYYFLQLDKKNPTVDSQTLGKNIIGWVDPNDVANATLYVNRYHSDRVATYTEEIDPSKIINENGYFRYYWDGEMISLCNNSKCKPTMMRFDSNEYNKFAEFPVHIYTPDKIIIGLRLLYDTNENEGSIKFLGAIPALNTGDTVSKERYNLPLNSTVDPLQVSGYSITDYQKNLSGLTHQNQSKGGINMPSSVKISDINSVDERGFLPISVNNTDKIAQLLNTIDVTESFGPRYATYNESATAFIMFCDYSNNCRKSVDLVDSIPQPHNNNFTTKKINFSDSTDNLTNFDSYQNTDAGIRIVYPKKWNDVINGSNSILFGRRTNVGEYVFNYRSPSETFLVEKADRLLPLSPKQHATQLFSDWASRYTNFNLMESKPTILSGKLAHRLVFNYTADYTGEQKTWITTVILSNNGANSFIIYYTCLAEDYAHNLPNILKIVHSFKFLDTSSTREAPVFLTYENTVEGVSMQYKSDWERHENIGILPLSLLASFISPLESDLDKYQERINLDVQNLPSNFSLQNNAHKYVDNLVRSGLSSSHEIDKIVTGESNSLGNGWQFFTYGAKIRDTIIMIEELWKVIDDKIFRIELLCEITKCTQYDSVYFKMVDSLRILPPDSSRWKFLTYENPSVGMRTQYPIDWKLQEYSRNVLQNSSKIVDFWPPLHNRSILVDTVIYEMNLNATIEELVDRCVNAYQNQSIDKLVDRCVNASRNHTIDRIGNNMVNYYRNSSSSDFKSSLDFKLLKMNNTFFSGLPGFMLEFTFSKSNLPFRGIIIGTVLDDLYIFRYAAIAEKFNTYLPKVMHMAESFDIGLG